MPGQPVKIGPFVGGMNTYSGPTSIADTEAVELLNVDIDLDGSIVSRPPLAVATTGVTGSGHIIGVYRSTTDVVYIIYAFATEAKAYNTSDGVFTTIATGDYTASVQYNDFLWLIKRPSGVTQGGTKWSPAGASDIPTMPRGLSACVYKERVFISASRTSDDTSINRVKFSNPADPATWTSTDYFDVSAGDGQDITKLIVFDAGIVIFKSDSTFVFAYESAPTKGQIQQISASIGANNNYCVVEYENNLFVMHEANVYRISNWNWEHANIKIPFEYSNRYGIDIPDGSSISIVGNRLICRYFDSYYVLGLKTGAWVKWEFKARENLITNSSFETDTANYAGGGGDVVTRDTTEAFVGVASAKSVSSGGTQKQVAFISPLYGEFKIGPGSVVTGSAYVKSNTDTGLVYARFQFTTIGGGILSTEFGAKIPISNNWQRVSLTAVAPAGTVKFRLSTILDSDLVDPEYYEDALLVEAGSDLLPYMTGSVVYAPSEFVGNPTLNPATGLTKYFAASYATGVQEMYTFEDKVADVVEAFTTRIVTKSYDFGPSYSFKRLFWWGVDILSKTLTTFKVSPVVYNTPVKWSQLVGVPFTSLGTWGRPLDVSIDVTDSVNSSNPSNYRTFVKLLKSLRFRQVQFTLESTLDGTSQTGPLRVFSLTAFVDSRETVVKKVS